MSDKIYAKAAEHIKARRFGEARAVLELVADESKGKAWLAKLDQVEAKQAAKTPTAPPKQTPQPKPKRASNKVQFAIIAVIIGAVIIGLGGFAYVSGQVDEIFNTKHDVEDYQLEADDLGPTWADLTGLVADTYMLDGCAEGISPANNYEKNVSRSFTNNGNDDIFYTVVEQYKNDTEAILRYRYLVESYQQCNSAIQMSEDVSFGDASFITSIQLSDGDYSLTLYFRKDNMMWSVSHLTYTSNPAFAYDMAKVILDKIEG